MTSWLAKGTAHWLHGSENQLLPKENSDSTYIYSLGQWQHRDLHGDSVGFWCHYCRCDWSVSDTVAQILYDSPAWSSCKVFESEFLICSFAVRCYQTSGVGPSSSGWSAQLISSQLSPTIALPFWVQQVSDPGIYLTEFRVYLPECSKSTWIASVWGCKTARINAV